MKKCSKCGEVKPFDEFYKRARSKDGLFPHCKACDIEKSKSYYAANKSKSTARNAAYYHANSGKITAQKKDYRARNAEENRAKAKEYRTANREKVKQWRMAHRAANAEKIKLEYKAYQRNLVDGMGSSYIKHLLTCNTILSRKDIPDWLVEAKREQLKLKRELRK